MESASDTTPAFLLVDGETVYELAPNSVLNIGRLGTNDIVLDDYQVSREHAVLKSASGEFTLIDLASTHGTFINGHRVDRATLQFGDRIQISSHEMSLSQDLPAVGQENAAIPGRRLVRSLDRRLKFFGGLNEFALITLVQFLSQERQSGLLLLEMGQTPGPRLYFRDGEIIHVSDDKNLAELLTRQYHPDSLFFYFHHEINFPPRTIQESTANYLIALCQAHDERQGAEKALAEAGALPADSLDETTKLHPPAGAE